MHSTDWLSELPQRLSAANDAVVLSNILLATDFSQCSTRALDCALGIASRYESQLCLFHCIDPAPYNLVGPEPLWKTVEDTRRELEQVGSNLRREGRTNDFGMKVVVEVGDVSAILPQVVKDLETDLIVIGTHGRTGWQKMLLGSVAESVMDGASCPVLTVGSSVARTRIQGHVPKNILLVSEAARRSQLAESYAFSLACKHRSRLTVVDVLENRSGRVVAQVSELQLCESDLREAIPDKALTTPQQLPVEIGTESSLILQVANRTAADLVVISVPEDHKFTDRFVSTNSYGVVCGAPCPVLSVRDR
jgi:nucleotide-binding universal stress UspA family protein